MRRAPRFLLSCLLVGAAGLLLGPGGGAAQPAIGIECDLERFRVLESSVYAQGHRITYVGGPRLLCPDGTRIQADSAVIYSAQALSRLMGNVYYDSPDRTLRSQDADYYEDERRLFARGDVDFTDKVRGVRLFGDRLTYLAAYEGRAEERVSVTDGRPRALFPPQGVEGEPPPEDAEPYEVEADRLLFEGDRYVFADGDVRLVRDSIEATADSLAYDQQEAELQLDRNAHLLSPRYDLFGDRIVLLIPGDEIRDVTAEGSARLLGEDYDLTGDRLTLGPPDADAAREIHSEGLARLQGGAFDLVGDEIRGFLRDDRLQRIVAVHRPGAERGATDGPEPGTREAARIEAAEREAEPEEDERPERARALTEDFMLLADSVHIELPDEVLDSVVGVGRARGETIGRETPDWSRIPDMPRSDWIEGDTVVATFVVVDGEGDAVALTADASGDPTLPPGTEGEPRYRLDGLEAMGNARSLYRMPPEAREEGDVVLLDEEGLPEEEPEPEEADPIAADTLPADTIPPDPDEEVPVEDRIEAPLWAISYVLGERIRIVMEDGEVRRMEVKGMVDGVHLEPERDGRAEEEGDG